MLPLVCTRARTRGRNALVGKTWLVVKSSPVFCTSFSSVSLALTGSRHEPFNFTQTGANSISPVHLRVCPTGRTCGERNEIKKNNHPENATTLFARLDADAEEVREHVLDVPGARRAITNARSIRSIWSDRCRFRVRTHGTCRTSKGEEEVYHAPSRGVRADEPTNKLKKTHKTHMRLWLNLLLFCVTRLLAGGVLAGFQAARLCRGCPVLMNTAWKSAVKYPVSGGQFDFVSPSARVPHRAHAWGAQLSFGSPHVCPTGRTCGEPNEIK